MTEVITIKFRGRGKAYFFDPAGVTAVPGEQLVVETSKGMELGTVLEGNHLVEDSDTVQPLRPVVRKWDPAVRLSVDTTRAEIVRRVYDCAGPFLVNDISAGEDDPEMLETVGRLGLSYVAMHKRGDPRTMDALCEYPDGIVAALVAYFTDFARKAADHGIADWILDPGLGFAKTAGQNWEILEGLEALQVFGRPILIGAADKRFTLTEPPFPFPTLPDESPTERAHRLALQQGAHILRVHDVPAAVATVHQIFSHSRCTTP